VIILYIFPRFGLLYREKPGNPGSSKFRHFVAPPCESKPDQGKDPNSIFSPSMEEKKGGKMDGGTSKLDSRQGDQMTF
jgi:hypothetical protein